MGAELNEMAFYHSISSITNTIWYMDVQKYQSWRKLGQFEVGGEKSFFMSCFDYLMTSQRLHECKIMKCT